MFEDLKIIDWPDPRLKKVSQPIARVTPELRELAVRMLEVMRQAKGVGLAAPQVGQNIRMFVINPSGEPNDNRVYVNPVLSDAEGEESSEEGCLSLPTINVQVSRSKAVRMQATDLEGNPIDQVETGYIARIWQHENDHLNGVLIIDRMGLGDRLKYRRTLKEMEEKFAEEHPAEIRNPKSETRIKSKGRKSE
jgi:peptide deformylase